MKLQDVRRYCISHDAAYLADSGILEGKLHGDHYHVGFVFVPPCPFSLWCWLQSVNG